ncbi:MAG: adaptin-binding domain-containing protein [Asgard group archaeon]|nr:adaptin-binding domain-containing protein [Asgard group archaeon]
MIPNHILILGSPNSGKLRVSKLISNDKDFPEIKENESHSGIIIKTSLSTKYYHIKLNILIDEYPEERNKSVTDEEKLLELEKWFNEFKSEEFGELREVLDGLVFTVNMKADSLEFIEKALETVSEIRTSLGDEESQWDGFISIIGSTTQGELVDDDTVEEIEDLVITHGFEFINLNTQGINEFKEKQGKDRVVELIESHEWTNMELLKVNPDQYEKNKMNKVEQMKQNLLEEKESMDLDVVFSKLSVAKERAEDMTQEQKEKYANEIIEEIIDFI